jgi:hypothetical protein
MKTYGHRTESQSLGRARSLVLLNASIRSSSRAGINPILLNSSVMIVNNSPVSWSLRRPGSASSIIDKVRAICRLEEHGRTQQTGSSKAPSLQFQSKKKKALERLEVEDQH